MHQKILPLMLLSSMSVGLYADEAVPYLWENSVTLESITNLQGGIKEGTRNLANLDVTLTVDTAAANWWNSGTLFVYVLGDYGKNPSDLTGDIQAISNISAPVNDLKIYEFWYQHHFFDDNIKWLVCMIIILCLIAWSLLVYLPVRHLVLSQIYRKSACLFFPSHHLAQ